MLKKIQPPLQLALQPSCRIRQFIVIIHVLALAACVFNALAVLYKIGCVVSVALHFWYSSKNINLEPKGIRHDEVTGWQVLVNGQFIAINIINSTVVTTFAIFLHFKYPDGKRVNIFIPSDSLANGAYRQLIVRLKTTTAK